ncbi:MAG TPA: hypothetical protein VN253_04010 [Kofleriaceae bacterium]|nr:hypothetical protein [Kofleriaceae bacterium]
MARLSDDLAGRRITARGFVHRAGACLMELELEEDVLAAWEAQGPVGPGIGSNGTRILERRDLRFTGWPGAMAAILFYTPPGVANPPHEHHNLVSIKRVLKGRYHVRQYERVRRVEPGVIAIRQVSELVDVNFDGPCVDMADDRHNVHWFGAVGPAPVLALNVMVSAPLPLAETFHGVAETRAPGPYYVDPTGAPDKDGLIFAPSISAERAAVFASLPLATFPSRLTALEPHS